MAFQRTKKAVSSSGEREILKELKKHKIICWLSPEYHWWGLSNEHNCPRKN